jgi:hypothetical protein
MALFVASVVFIAYIFGRILSILVKEEIKPGRRYFLALQRFLLVVISLTLLYISWLDYWVVLMFFLGIFASFIIKERYFYLGLALAVLSIISRELLVIYSFFMIIYGISYGSLNKGILKRLILYALPFLVLFFNFTTSYHYLFLSFISGALIFKE